MLPEVHVFEVACNPLEVVSLQALEFVLSCLLLLRQVEGALELAPLAGLQACRTFGLRWHRWGGVADGRKVLDPLDEPSTLLGHLAGDEALDGEHADLVLR